MKRLIVSVIGFAAMVACSPAKKDEPASPTAAPAAEAPAAAIDPSPTGTAGAEQLIRTLNGRVAAPGQPAETAAFFATDMATALDNDGTPDEVGAIDFDYRWNAQDTEVTGVTYHTAAAGPGRAAVTVSFKNFGETGTTYYDLCRRENGQWRILDVRSNNQDDGSVRAMLKLGPAAEATAC